MTGDAPHGIFKIRQHPFKIGTLTGFTRGFAEKIIDLENSFMFEILRQAFNKAVQKIHPRNKCKNNASNHTARHPLERIPRVKAQRNKP